MNTVSWRYRNVINPWQTPREITLAERFLDRLFAGRAEPEVRALVRCEEADRDWSRPV